MHCAENEKSRLNRFRRAVVTALKRGVNETLPCELAFHGNALQCAHARIEAFGCHHNGK